MDCRVAAIAISNRSGREVLPRAFILLIHGVALAYPVLHLKIASERIGPLDAKCVVVFFLVESNDYPLWMKRVVLACEIVAQVRIAFPIRVRVSIVEAGVAIELGAAVAREAAVRQ